MKKLLFIAPHISGRGGTETVLRTVVEMLIKNKSNFIPQIFVLGGSTNKEWLSGLPHKESTYYSNKVFRNIVYFFDLLRFLRKEKPDMVISLDPMICLLVNRIRQITKGNYSIVSWIHFSLNTPSVRSHLIPHADYHLAISTGIANQLAELNISKDKIFTIFNPVNRTDQIINRPKNKTVFVYVGRIIFEGQKRIKDMLSALSKVDGDWTLEVFGDGKDIEICRQYAQKLSIDSKIHWNGYVLNPWASMKEATALLLTSAYEGMPMVLAEAISRGVYCISSDCETGPADIIKENVNGDLYQLERIDELSNLLQCIIDGKSLPDHSDMKESIRNMYLEEYYRNFLDVISDINESLG